MHRLKTYPITPMARTFSAEYMIYMQKRGLREIITSISCDLMGHDGSKVFYEFTLVSLYVMLKWLNLCLIHPLLRLYTSLRLFWNISRSVKNDRYNNLYPLDVASLKLLAHKYMKQIKYLFNIPSSSIINKNVVYSALHGI